MRLTELVTALPDKIDARQLAFNPAVELLYLTHTEQTAVADAIDRVLAEEKKRPKSGLAERFRKFFPTDYSQKQIKAVIDRLLCGWQKQQSTT